MNSVAIGAASGGVVPVTITLAADPGDKQLDIWFNPKPDPSTSDGTTGIIIDNYSSEAGVAFGRQVTRARPFEMKLRRDVGFTNGVYAAGQFGQQASSGGLGFVSDRMVPTRGVGSTIEFWFKHPGNAGNQIILGFAGTWIGVSGTAFILGNNGANTTITGSAPANQWLHVALTFDGPQTLLHVDGVLKSTLNNQNTFGDANFAIRSFEGNSAPLPTGALLQHLSIFDQPMRTDQAFTAPTAPYTGSEARLLHLWPFDGTGIDTAVRA